MRFFIGVIVGLVIWLVLGLLIVSNIHPNAQQWGSFILGRCLRLVLEIFIPTLIAGWISGKKGWLCGITLSLLNAAVGGLVLYWIAAANYQQMHDPSIFQTVPINLIDSLVDNFIETLKVAVGALSGELGVFLKLRIGKK